MRTGKKKPGRQAIQRTRSRLMPPPVTTQCTCGWCCSCWPQVWSTTKNPISAPRCVGSPAIVRRDSAACAKQNAVHDRFVAERDRRHGLRHGEDDLEVVGVEEVGFALLDPLRPREGLTLRAVPISARVVPEAPMVATITLLHMPAERGGPAPLDGRHHTARWQRERSGLEPIAM